MLLDINQIEVGDIVRIDKCMVCSERKTGSCIWEGKTCIVSKISNSGGVRFESVQDKNSVINYVEGKAKITKLA